MTPVRVRLACSSRAAVANMPDPHWVCLITWRARLQGLLGRSPPAPREIWCLPRCSAVHTLGMAYPIDVVWLNAEGRIVRLWVAMPPGRLAWQRGATEVLELAAHESARLAWHVGLVVPRRGGFVWR